MSANDVSPTSVANGLLEEFGGTVVNVLLGGLLLWVGQTTFEHNGELAGMEQRFESVNNRHQMLLSRYDRIVESINTKTHGRFTADDGDKLADRIDSVQLSTQALREQVQDRLTELRVQVSALEVQLQSTPAWSATTAAQSQNVHQIHGEMASIRHDINRLSLALNAVWKGVQPQTTTAAARTQAAQQTSYQNQAGFAAASHN